MAVRPLSTRPGGSWERDSFAGSFLFSLAELLMGALLWTRCTDCCIKVAQDHENLRDELVGALSLLGSSSLGAGRGDDQPKTE